jgi:hypothetical protein
LALTLEKVKREEYESLLVKKEQELKQHSGVIQQHIDTLTNQVSVIASLKQSAKQAHVCSIHHSNPLYDAVIVSAFSAHLNSVCFLAFFNLTTTGIILSCRYAECQAQAQHG